MKRGVFDILRRGLDNTFANWQVSLIRFLQAVLFIAIVIGAAIVVVAPILVSLGINLTDLDTPDDMASLAGTFLQKWVLIAWVLIGVLVLLAVLTLIYSFVEAGCARVMVDGERMAGSAPAGPRARYRVFSMERFLTGAKEGWWTVFWIYNGIWGIGCLILLVPLILAIALMLVFRERQGLAVFAGCLGLLVALLASVVVMIVAGVWSNRAIVNWAARRTSAAESISDASREIREDFGRHALVAIAIFVVAMAASAFFSSFSMFAGFGDALGRGENIFFSFMLPLRVVGYALNSAFSAGIGSWFMASYAAIALDPRR